MATVAFWASSVPSSYPSEKHGGGGGSMQNQRWNNSWSFGIGSRAVNSRKFEKTQFSVFSRSLFYSFHLYDLFYCVKGWFCCYLFNLTLLFKKIHWTHFCKSVFISFFNWRREALANMQELYCISLSLSLTVLFDDGQISLFYVLCLHFWGFYSR